MKAARQAIYRDGRSDGRTLDEWLPDVVATIVDRFNPLKVIVFGSLGRGEEGNDIDLLVVLPTIRDKRVPRSQSDRPSGRPCRST